jgi:hypothetical protein
MEAYCDKVWRLEDKFYGLELNHVARRYNETADELAKIASGRTTVPPDVFSRDLHQPSIKTDDTLEPEEASAQPEAPSAAEGEAPSAAERRGRAEWGHAQSKLADPVPTISPPRRATPRQSRSSATGAAHQVVRLAG